MKSKDTGIKSYKLNRFGGQANDAMIELDKKRRAKIERKVGKLTDAQWFEYKQINNISRSKY